MYIGIAGMQRMGMLRITPHTVAGFICFGKVGHGVPAAHITPQAVKGKHADIGRTFHDRVVNRLAATSCKYLCIWPGKKAIWL